MKYLALLLIFIGAIFIFLHQWWDYRIYALMESQQALWLSKYDVAITTLRQTKLLFLPLAFVFGGSGIAALIAGFIKEGLFQNVVIEEIEDDQQD